MPHKTLRFTLGPIDNARLANLCGVYDDNIQLIGDLLDVQINRRGDTFKVTGAHPARARELITQLSAKAHETVDPETVRRFATAEPKGAGGVVAGVKARNEAQRAYLEAIVGNDVTFGVGASGTGKTFLAMACALEALKRGDVRRIVLVRPAVEAGESLGFLPGDPVQKVNPYLRPLQDALDEISSGDQEVEEHLGDGRIELAPLAYMRGRTLSDSFVILDEAQNTTRAQMQMFLTRIGTGSRCVVTGDESQVDLRDAADSGLSDVIGRVGGVQGCAVVRFRPSDTMRHPVVGRILDAYGD